MASPEQIDAAKTCRLFTLGGLSLVDAHRTVLGQQPRRLALLAMLASTRDRGMSRDRLVACLSPESATKSARHALHQLLYYVRQQAGEDAFIGTDPLRLNPRVITSDHAEFHASIERDDLAHAVSLYHGPFLDGFHLDSVEFDEWASAERSRIAALHLDGLFRLAATSEAAGDNAGALTRWQQLDRMDPVSGRVALGLMRAFVAVGDTPGALRHAQAHGALVRSELVGEVDRRVSELAARLQSGDQPSSAARGVHVVRQPDPAPADPVTLIPAATVPSRRVFRRRHGVGAVVLGIALVVSAWSVYRTRGGPGSVTPPTRLTANDALLVGDIVAPASDSLAARALTELLRASLGSGALRVVSRSEMDQSLRRMQLPVTSTVAANVARELAVRQGFAAILHTNLSPVGRGFLLSARLTAPNGAEWAATTESAPNADALIPAVGRLASTLRAATGDASRPRGASLPLEPVSTHSLRALTLYTQAQEASNVPRGRPQQSPEMLALLREAIAEDSAFAMAHRRLGAALFNLGFIREAIAEMRAAERFSDRLTEVERLSVLVSLRMNLRDYPRSITDAKGILRLEPGNLFARNWLIFNYFLSGQYDVAEREIPPIAPMGINAFWSNLREYQGRRGEALDSARAYYRRTQDSTAANWRRSGRGRLATVHAVQLAYDSALYYAQPADGSDRGSPIIVAASEFARGQLAKAGATQRLRAISPDGESQGSSHTATESYTALATILITGDAASANRRLNAVLADSSYRQRDPADRHIRPVLALALAGRSADARRELDAIERASNADVRIARKPDLVLARGAVALAEHRLPDAIAAFREASTMATLGSFDACRVCALPWLARAYEAAGQADSAAAVYERYLATGDPNRVLLDAAWRAVTLLRLGALHAQLGDTARAVKRLSELVELWHDADPVLQPRVETARRRLLALRPGG